MASLALEPSGPTLPILAELRARQPLLAAYGLALLAIAVPLLALQLIDPRTIAGVSVWVKPVKFLVSVAIFALTAAWYFGYIRPERRHALLPRSAVMMIVAGGSFELAWIGWQASQGLGSHFNTGTPFFTLMYAMMGLFAVMLVGSTLPMAWEIGRRPTAGLRTDFVASVVVGLLLTFALGGGLGSYMSSQTGHSVGAEGGRVLMFGWNRSGGDLRIAHFLGIHSQQAIPILAALAAATGFTGNRRWLILTAGTIAYVAVSIALFAQAVAGRPLLPL